MIGPGALASEERERGDVVRRGPVGPRAQVCEERERGDVVRARPGGLANSGV